MLGESVIDCKFRYFETLIQTMWGSYIAFETICELCTKTLNHRRVKCKLSFIHLSYIFAQNTLYPLWHSYFSHNPSIVLKIIYNLLIVWIDVSKWRKLSFVAELMKMLKLPLFKKLKWLKWSKYINIICMTL